MKQYIIESLPSWGYSQFQTLVIGTGQEVVAPRLVEGLKDLLCNLEKLLVIFKFLNTKKQKLRFV